MQAPRMLKPSVFLIGTAVAASRAMWYSETSTVHLVNNRVESMNVFIIW